MNAKHKGPAPDFFCALTTRRDFFRQSLQIGAAGLIGASGLWLPAWGTVDMPRSTVVETDKGKVQGYVYQGVSIFKGIPYGASTAGNNRFHPPQPALPWMGIRDALDFGPTAPQSLNPSGGLGEGQSEDCLVLNVFTPSTTDHKKRPVMFWCHGGGFSSLSASTPAYDGTHLCNRGDVVVVTVNHRLNALDIPFVFDNTDSDHTAFGLTTGSEEERSLADKVSDTWIAFARTGTPNCGKLPHWPAYSKESRQVMVIDNASKIMEDPFQSRRVIMQKVLELE